MQTIDSLAAPGSAAQALARRNTELTAKHEEIWDLMSLSRGVRDELNAVVVRVNAQMSLNRDRNPEQYDEVFKNSKRKDAITHEEYVADHLRRWDVLRLTVAAQNELLAAAEFCWTALHDPSAELTTTEREKAEAIRTMMKALGGPPPCCDENIFDKASPNL